MSQSVSQSRRLALSQSLEGDGMGRVSWNHCASSDVTRKPLDVILWLWAGFKHGNETILSVFLLQPMLAVEGIDRRQMRNQRVRD